MNINFQLIESRATKIQRKTELEYKLEKYFECVGGGEGEMSFNNDVTLKDGIKA